MTGLAHARRPCGECPWRVDVPPGKFETCRYDALRDTSAGPRGESAPLDAPLFACHMAAEGRDQACAGWLAVEGHRHVGVRLAVATGRLPGEALSQRPGWPELHQSYDEMAEAKAR